MFERAGRTPMRRAGTAGEVELHDSCLGPIREEPERLDRRSEQGDHRRPNRGREVHLPGVACHQGPALPEQGGGCREIHSRGACDPTASVFGGSHCAGNRTGGIPVHRAAKHHDVVALFDEASSQPDPVMYGPLFGSMRSAWSYRDDLAGKGLQQTLRRVDRCPGQKDLERAAIGNNIEFPGSIEVPLGNRALVPVTVLLGSNEQGASHPMMRIGVPVSPESPAKLPAPEVPLQIEFMGELLQGRRTAQGIHESLGPAARIPLHDPGEARIVLQQRLEPGFGHKCDLRLGVADPKCADQGGGEQDVADRAESENQDLGGHRANVDINFQLRQRRWASRWRHLLDIGTPSC